MSGPAEVWQCQEEDDQPDPDAKRDSDRQVGVGASEFLGIRNGGVRVGMFYVSVVMTSWMR